MCVFLLIILTRNFLETFVLRLPTVRYVFAPSSPDRSSYVIMNVHRAYLKPFRRHGIVSKDPHEFVERFPLAFYRTRHLIMCLKFRTIRDRGRRSVGRGGGGRFESVDNWPFVLRDASLAAIKSIFVLILFPTTKRENRLEPSREKEPERHASERLRLVVRRGGLFFYF